MNLLYFDCPSGISGDMVVGAFLDMGIKLTALARELTKMQLPSVYDIEAEKTTKNGVSATAFRVIAEDVQGSSSFSQMEQWISESGLEANIKRNTLKTLRLLGNAREKVYGENGLWLDMVNAVTCVVNLVAASVCIGWVGAEAVMCSPLAEGSGFAETRGGFMRLPVPTVMELARTAGVPFEICAEKTQLITETGAAIVCTQAQSFGNMPSMTVSAVGFGAGTKDLGNRANVLRVILGRNEYQFFEKNICVTHSDTTYGGGFWQCQKER